MADNFLEVHYQEYEAKKEAWLRKRKHLPKQKARQISKPDDEAL
ncbi:MAG: dehydrogenase [Prevotella sp.]|nr:dehydrogenase [Prevotella sp.]